MIFKILVIRHLACRVHVYPESNHALQEVAVETDTLLNALLAFVAVVKEQQNSDQ